MRDRLLLGAFAGAIAILFGLASDFFWHNLLRFAQSSWVIGVSYLLLGHRMHGMAEAGISVVANFIFGGSLGALFAWLVSPRPGEGDYLLRGAGYAMGVWFATLAAGTLFRVPGLFIVTWQTAAAQLFTAIGWGLIFGSLLQRWDKAYEPAQK